MAEAIAATSRVDLRYPSESEHDEEELQKECMLDAKKMAVDGKYYGASCPYGSREPSRDVANY